MTTTMVATGYRPLDAWPCAAAYVDGQGGILSANDAFLDICGLAANGSPERHTVLGIFVDDDREPVRETLGRSGGSAQPVARSVRLVGSRSTTSAQFVPIARRSCDSFWLVLLLPAQRTSRGHDDPAFRAALTAGIAHDLRGPLQVVLGWTSMLKRTHDDPERLERALTIIEENVKLEMALTKDLLELLRPSFSRSPLPRHRIDLSALVEREVRAVQPLAQERGVQICLTARADSAREIAVEGIEVHLRRVVANLVGNALKFTPAGGSVDCRLWRSAAWAGIVVRDTGLGIDGQQLPNVFNAFRHDSLRSTENGDGLGLGLSVVRQLVEQHGGTVTAASPGSGRGATFTVLLPAVP
jgi:signal transduction histidine kinase